MYYVSTVGGGAMGLVFKQDKKETLTIAFTGTSFREGRVKPLPGRFLRQIIDKSAQAA